MGVTGLWQVLQPCARPIKLETLNRKRLAVDASIWIYQFLKAVRDKEGNALRNSHVVGFFRRICKLLFFGIKPVFVFDGGAPALKRQTIIGRKARREGRREDAVRTAGKLLAIQMQRRAEEDERRRREERQQPTRVNEEEQEEELPDDLVYAEELQMTPQERKQNRTFKKKDAYHLPSLDVNLSEMGAPNDPRIMSQNELEEYARQFHTGEDINLYDFSKIDFNGQFFQSLPPSDRYNILNAARLRSRLRMGYSKEQLDTMFPDRMAFSKFQIERVKERNELTQRLMNLNGMNGDGDDFLNGTARVAGERGKEYVLVKNDGVEGGWALGVVSNKNEGERNQPIDVDVFSSQPKDEDADWEDDDGFEDVPIEGLNRLPKQPLGPRSEIEALRSSEVKKARQALYMKRRNAAWPKDIASPGSEADDPDSLFLPQEPATHVDDEGIDDLFEDVLPPVPIEEDDEELQRAIAMSLERDEDDEGDEIAANRAAMLNGPRIDRPLDYNAKNAKAGRAFAHVTNSRALGSLRNPSSGKVDSQGPEAAYVQPKGPANIPTLANEALNPLASSMSRNSQGFGGPLPFESIDLGKSFLRPKKKPAEEGGFEKEDQEKRTQPLPPWFSGDVRTGVAAQKAMDEPQFDDWKSEPQPRDQGQPILRRNETHEVIDLEDPRLPAASNAIIELETSDGEPDEAMMGDFQSIEPEPRMSNVADLIRVEPPIPTMASESAEEVSTRDLFVGEAEPEVVLPDRKDLLDDGTTLSGPVRTGKEFREKERSQADKSETILSNITDNEKDHDERREEKKRKEQHYEKENSEEEIEWSESDLGDDDERQVQTDNDDESSGKRTRAEPTRSASVEFEDVQMDRLATNHESSQHERYTLPPPMPNEDNFDRAVSEPALLDEDDFSDPEDEELMRQLAVEAEEHARFASTLNAQSQLQSAEDYEKELRQLRNQQKKDRRDADEVSHIMVTECQQLLKLFGLPYITAPMEAEAQCAELVSLGLVDGIVTDDSDIFLFGGTRVYKNLFNQAKFVECYLASDLEKEYSLDRKKIIQIAHLLGSDYAEGLPSIGPVTALEILSEFSSLEAFKDWWTEVQKGGAQMPDENKSSFRKKFKRNATKLFLPPAFPDKRVDEAYLQPEVDSDPSPFQWGVPDLDSLRSFLMATIGWSQERADEILVPVIRDMNRREHEGTQANITQFFTGTVGIGAGPKQAVDTAHAAGVDGSFAPRRRAGGKSKRMEDALGRLHQQARDSTREESEGQGGVDGGMQEAPERIMPMAEKPRSRKKAKAGDDVASSVSGDGDGDEAYAPPNRMVSRAKRKRHVAG